MRISFIVLPLALIGCLDPTQITVELYKNGTGAGSEGGEGGAGDTGDEDACAPMPQTAVTIAVAEAIGATSPAAVADTCTADTSHDGATARIGSIVAVPHDDPSVDVAIEAMMNLSGNDPTDSCVPEAEDKLPPDCILARRQLRFIEHTSLELPIVLQVQCAGVLCDDDQTCVNGDCVDAQVDCSNGVCDEPDPPDDTGGWPVVLEGIGGVDLGGMARDGQGNVYVAGTCGGALKVLSAGVANPPTVGDPESAGSVTIFVVKLSADGEYLTGTTFGSSAPLDAASRAVRDLVVRGQHVFVGAEAFPGMDIDNLSSANARGGLLVQLSRNDLSLVGASSLNPVGPDAVDLQALAVADDEILGGFNFDAPNFQQVLGVTPPAIVGVGLGALQTTSSQVAFLSPSVATSGNLPQLRVSAASATPNGSLSFLAGINSVAIRGDGSLTLTAGAGAFLAAYTPQRTLQDVFGFVTDAPIRITGLGSDVMASRICAVGTVERDAANNAAVEIAVSSFNEVNPSFDIVGTNARFGFIACPALETPVSAGADPWVVLESATRENETVLLGATSHAGTLYVGGWASSPVQLMDGSTATEGSLRPFVAAIDPANESVTWSADLEPEEAKLERIELAAVSDEEVVVAGQFDAAFELGSDTVPEGRKVFIRSVAREP